MTKKLVAVVLSVVLILPSLLLPLAGCKTEPAKADIWASDFAIKLFQRSVSSEENSMISPMSVICALAMVANGADANTLAQMEAVLGFTVAELNEYLSQYMRSISSADNCKINIANSIWYKNDFTIQMNFLQLCADYYGASVNKTPFDSITLKAINDWVSDNTDGMIKNILDNIRSDAVMYLINAIAFDAEWQRIYLESEVRSGTFTAISGETRNVQMMYGTESAYLDDGFATGFIKYYSGGRYAFVALLPNDGMTIGDYVLTLSGERLAATISNAQQTIVYTAIPKFESEYSIGMTDILSLIGMSDAFMPDLADFTKLGRSDAGNLYIGEVIHKTFISVDERGTKAGAATSVEVRAVGSFTGQTVYLDRPFVYMIIDCETNLPVFAPLFIGTVLDI